MAAAAQGVRRYGLYVCETQEQADDHVANVAAMLESKRFGETYPAVSQRALGKYGNSKGWRRNRLRTASGFTLDAIGLDTAARGAKVDEDRPDLMVFDDLDGELDTPAATEKKIKVLTRKLIPAGAADCATLAIQNLVLPDGIFARLADGRAEFLSDRIVSGPYPALRDMAYEMGEDGRYWIVAGEPTWQGQDRERCQEMLNDMGLTAFLAECQHEGLEQLGGMFDHIEFRHCAWDQVPDLVRVVVWADPAVTSTDQSDSHGIQADGVAADGTIYRLWSWEARTSPEDVMRRAIEKAVELKAEEVGFETDQGGDTWRSVYREAVEAIKKRRTEDEEAEEFKAPRFASEKAGAGFGPKAHRGGLMLADYEKGRIVHVLGTHQVLERALRRFPRTKPFDLADAAFWSWHSLRRRAKGWVAV